MKKVIKKLKGKKVLSMLLALIMVLTIASPAFSPIIAKAANTYPVELAFNNLFVFDEWARNKLSTTYGPDPNDGTITTDIEDGSFNLKKTNPDALEGFNSFSWETGKNAASNMNYYMIAVEENTTYEFSYEATNVSNIQGFNVLIFTYDTDGSYIANTPYPATQFGRNSFGFTTGENTGYIQVRFTIPHTGAAEIKVSNIAMCEIETIYSENLFSFSEWANRGQSHLPATSLGFGGGTVDVNPEEESMTLNTNASGSLLLTNFTMSATATDNSAYHTIPVEEGKEYTLAYNLVNADNLPAAVYCQPYIAYYKADGSFITFQNYETPGYGKNNFTFTTPAGTEYIQVVFSLHTITTVSSITVKDIGVYEDITTVLHKTTPIRKVYTYGNDETYTNLPTPSYIPEGYVFAGWFTEPDGEGQRITPETKVLYGSYTVYPKYEPEVDTLEIASMPTKTVYTKGEKLNTAGLSLKATVDSQVDTDGDGTLETVTRTFNINSGVYCTPEYLNTVGTQTITAHYGGKTVTFPVTVLENDTTDIVVNGAIIEDVEVTNNKYTLNSDATAFNRYKIAYSTDSYVKGIITFENDITEEFFLEPSDNGSFVSLIDDFLDENTHNYIKSVEFTCLDNELGKFQLKAVSTELKEGIPEIAYFNNNEYEMGIDVRYGGVVSELYDIDDNVVSRVYKDKHYYDGNNPSAYLDKTKTLVDYESQLDKLEAGDQSLVSATDKNGDSGSNKVNLINTLDRGRYLQQSYYGTDERPYVQGEFNEAPWKYNPVQGGNVGEEPSKVIDYEITDTYVYVKARPMEWEKWSDDHVDVCKHTEPITNANGEIEYRKMHAEKLYGNDVVSDTYVEAWYYFSDGMIKVQNRKVDYSGLPEKETEQEMPALYLIEPLNHYVYNNVSEADAWSKDFDELGDSLQNIEEPEFWGIHKSYSDEHYKNKGLLEGDLDKDNNDIYDAYSICNENWAAFTASEDEKSFGVGIYTPGVEKMYYGVMPQIYAQKYNEDGTITETYDPNYRHAETANPSPEMPTSYIAPLKKSVFKSYDPTEYTYYLTTGTAEKIRYDFSLIGDKEAAVELAKAKVAVPETVYMDPANNRNGEFYVNNILNKSDFYNVETEAVSDETDMYFGIHVQDAESFTVNVTNAITSSNDIILGNADGTGNIEGETINFDSSLIDSYISEGGFSLRLTNALQPGETATAKWDITVTMKDDSTKTYTAYTVLYAPERTVGAVAEARQVENSQNEISSWITGVNGVNHSQKSPLGSFHGDKSASGYFKDDPLYNENPPTYSTGETANDLINVANDSSGYYVMQTATNGHDSSRAQSYLGLLTVDGSRYTNTNQIPNLKVGYDALRRASGNWHKDTFHTYTNYYALGTIDSFTSTDLAAVPNTSEWIQERYFTNFAENHNIPERYTVVPSYDVSEIDGKYIHALNRSQCIQDFTLYITRRYATAGTSVLCSVTDKSGLRDAVLDGYAQPNDNAEFIEKLENAATILGDPSATQDEIDEARKELTENVTTPYYSLKYDNIFSAYEMSQYPVSMKVVGDKGTVSYNNGTITVVSGNITGGEAYTDYGSANHFYKVALKPNTEYVFEYDVTTDVKAQAFMFFYNSNGGSGDVPTNMSSKTDNGNWSSKSESNPWWGNYTNDSGSKHYAIKFTTGANTTQAAFRFGNTTNDPCTSTFSNIKLVEAYKYYENVEYTKTEAVYKEYESYGTLPVLSRGGYTFKGWVDEKGNAVTGANTAIGHTTIYSQWDIINYTITYNANGGNVTPKTQPYTVENDLTLPTPTRAGYNFQGWLVTAAEGNWELNGICSPGEVPAKMYGNVTLTAQWVLGDIPVYFDTILDFSKWNTTTASNATISNVTDNGFTLTSDAGVGEGTSSSPYFTVEPGKSYKIDMDITGDNWDVYIFFCDENGTWIDFNDGANRYSSNGGGIQTRVFTAPNKAEVVKAQIRVDANGSSNSVTFSDIRVYEAGTCASDVYVPYSNKVVQYGEPYGDLPTPTRPGYKFDGWKNVAGQWVNKGDPVNTGEAIYLYSQWTEIKYPVYFNENGAKDGTVKDVTVTYKEKFTFEGGLTTDGAIFRGWSLTENSTEPDFEVNETISVSELDGVDANNSQPITFHAVWELTDDVVLDDNVVADFGLSMTISPFSNDADILFHHAIDYAENSYEIGFSTDGGKTITETATGAYGNFRIDGTNVIYTPTKVALGVEEIEFYTKVIYRGTTVKVVSNTIEVVPASNVYYEEKYINVKEADATNTKKLAWETDGTASDKNLDVSTVNNVDGFDNAYNVQNDYSNGSALKVIVDSTNKNSKNQTFDFVGTGIDIVSRCGSNTGMMLISVKKEVDGNMKTVKSGLVDTYCAEGTFNQTPVFSWSGDHGKYTVEIGAMYLTTAGALKANSSTKGIKKSSLIDTGLEMNASTDFETGVLQAMLDEAGVEDVSAEDVELIWFDDNSIFNGGTGVAPTKKGTRADGGAVVALENYIDGFRVYNTLNKDDSYYADTEKKASYANVIENLAPVNSADGSLLDELFGIAYITGLGDATSITFEQYKQSGPKGELYLNGGKAISFKINRGENERVMLGLRAVRGATTINVNGYDIAINSATEMYYDISNCIGTGNVTVTINNIGANILAVNHIKFTGGSDSDGTVITPRSMARSADATEATTNKFLPITQEDLVAIEESMSAEPIPTEVKNGLVIPIVEEEDEIPGDNTDPDDDNIDDDTNTDGGSTDADDETDGFFDIFSLIRILIEFIKNILFKTVGNIDLL